MTEIIGIARRAPSNPPPGVGFVQADVATDDLTPLFAGAHAVIHLAWMIQPLREPERLRRTNVGGSQRVFDAAVAARVPALIHASSVGAYGSGPKHERVDETYRTDGIPSSLYSQQKVEVEGLLEECARKHSSLRVVSMRPGLIFKRGAASEIRRLFIGAFVPPAFLRKRRVVLVPRNERFRCCGSP